MFIFFRGVYNNIILVVRQGRIQGGGAKGTRTCPPQIVRGNRPPPQNFKGGKEKGKEKREEKMKGKRRKDGKKPRFRFSIIFRRVQNNFCACPPPHLISEYASVLRPRGYRIIRIMP